MTFDPDALARELLAGVVVPTNGQDPADVDPTAHLLGLRPVGVIAAEVDAMGEPKYLFRPVWPSDAHGVVAATFKAGKTWLSIDAAVSVASGTPWLGIFPVEHAGPVVVFLGEGGKRKLTRRGRAVAAARGLDWDTLPIVLAERVPKLRDEKQVNALAVELDRHPAVLVILDPLYLAAAGANSSAIYDMAGVLEPIQVVCQQANSALMLIHHNNRDTSRSGSDRMSGAGPAEWGRVLVAVDRVTGTEDKETGRTDVTLKLSFSGDEIPGGDHLIRRTVWADDPDDLGSELNYEVVRLGDDGSGGWDGPTECMAAVRTVFAGLSTGAELSTNQVVEHVRAYGHQFRDGTIRDAAGRLAANGVLAVRAGPRNAVMFQLVATDGAEEGLFL